MTRITDFIKPQTLRVIMEMDEVIDQLLLEADVPSKPKRNDVSYEESAAVPPDVRSTVPQSQAKPCGASQHRERLAALAAGGQAKQYLGKALTVEQIDLLPEDEVEKLYACYEARLGAAMVKTLGHTVLNLYSSLASKFLPIPPENQQALVRDLETDPLVEHVLSSAMCELHFHYSKWLAPLSVALSTVKHCQFRPQGPQAIVEQNCNGEPDQSREPDPQLTDRQQ